MSGEGLKEVSGLGPVLSGILRDWVASPMWHMRSDRASKVEKL